MLTHLVIAALALTSNRQQRTSVLLRTRGGQVPPPPRGPRPPEPTAPRPPPGGGPPQPPARSQPQQQAAPHPQPPPGKQQEPQARPPPPPQQPREPQPQPGPGVDVRALEKRSGVRLSWHVWPQSAADADSLAAPYGVIFSPLSPIEGLERLEKEPVRCGHCRGFLNPFARVEPHARRWACPLCSSWNPLPEDLASATSMPTELSPAHATIEYDLPAGVESTNAEAEPASLLLVVDCSLPSDEVPLAAPAAYASQSSFLRLLSRLRTTAHRPAGSPCCHLPLLLLPWCGSSTSWRRR
jgi:hypothetical protein